MSQEEIGRIVDFADNVKIELIKLKKPSNELLEEILNYVQEFSDKNKFIQVIKEKAFCTEKQVRLAAMLALRAHIEGLAIAKNPAIEFLLYLSATRQIRNAIELVGAKPEENACIILASSNDEDLKFLKENLQKIFSNIQEPFNKCTSNPEYIKELYKTNAYKSFKDLELTALTKIALTMLK